MSLIKEKRQLELEIESVTSGIARYQKGLKYARDNHHEDETVPGQQLMSRVIDQVTAAIEQDRTAVRRGKNRAAVDLIREVDSAVLAWHALRAILGSIAYDPTFTRVAGKAGRFVRDEVNYQRFADQSKIKYKMTQEHLKKSRSPAARRAVMAHMLKGEGTNAVQWTDEELIRIGSYILDIAITVTGWVKLVRIHTRRQTPRVLQATPEVRKWIEEAHRELALLTPARLPMIVPPRDWEGPVGGGYISEASRPLTLVKTRNTGYLESLAEVDMPDVYAAINAIQRTPWQINVAVRDVAKALFEMGVQVGGDGAESLPSRNPQEVPAAPAHWEGLKWTEIKAKHGPEYTLWAGRAAAIHESNRRMISKRLSATAAMNLADRFADDTLYFPHQMDFRGRVYPVSSYLQPQGDDLSKGLLRFAEGKPLGTDGVYWLKVHIANCFGVDKVSFADRIDWVDRHVESLLDSALNPLAPEAFWLTADEPFQALAACFEFAGWYAEGDTYVSHLPISVDGSCNGLQNFSALLRDSVGGKATNLVPGEAPADIYSEVARLTAEKVEADALKGNEHAVIFDGFVDRKLIKQPVMTLPYGATYNGMRGQIEEATKRAGNPMGLTQKNSWAACGYLTSVVREAIAEVVVAAVDAMDWLQKVARAVSSEDHPVSWITPCGFPVLQEYRQIDAKLLRIHINGQKRKLQIAQVGKKLDKRRQATGIAPNFVHSLDSSHLMWTTVLAQANGVDAFAMVHDSFGTHAADVGVLQAALREAFIEQYTPDVLANFKAEIESQAPGVDLPELPSMGDLDLNQIRDALYFFA